MHLGPGSRAPTTVCMRCSCRDRDQSWGAFVVDAGSNANYGTSFFSGQGNSANVPANEIDISLSGFKAIGFFYGSYLIRNEPYSVTLSTG